jgi:hypothetical protein
MPKLVKTKFVTGQVRFANTHLYKPISIIKGAEPKYTVTIIIPKSEKAEIARIKAVYKDVIGANEELFSLKPLIKNSAKLKDGDLEEVGLDYQNSYYINATTIEKPGVVDIDLNPIIDSAEIYDGCYGRASLTFYPYTTTTGAGIAVGLNNIQKLHDGERIKVVKINSDFE